MSAEHEHEVAIDTVDERYARLRLVQPDALSRLRMSVARHGVLHPVIVNGTADGARVVLDGFKRLAVLRERGAATVWVRVMHVPEPAAQAAMVTYNAAHHGLSELEEGWVVRSLVRGCKLPQTAVAELLGRHKSWVSRRLLLAEGLCASVQDDMRLGLVSATVARELVRLPRGNQAEVAQVVREHGLTSRQAAQLCARYVSTESREALAEVLADPLRFVEPGPSSPAPVARADPRLSAAAERIRRWLVRLDQAVAGVGHILGRHPVPSLGVTDHEVLAPHGAEVADRTRRVLEHVDALAVAAGKAGDGP